MSNPRDILNELKWRDDKELETVEVFYIHRGAPDDYKILKGDEIIDLGRSFIKSRDSSIPYHRVFQIIYKGDVIFSRDRE